MFLIEIQRLVISQLSVDVASNYFCYPPIDYKKFLQTLKLKVSSEVINLSKA